MALQSRVAVTLALTLLVSLAATRTADGEVPTVADFAACNDEAPAAIKAGTASPIVGDHVRANSARAGSITMNSIDFTGRVIESSDPQIHGMKAAETEGLLTGIIETTNGRSYRADPFRAVPFSDRLGGGAARDVGVVEPRDWFSSVSPYTRPPGEVGRGR